MAAVLVHEICHGRGSEFARNSAGQADMRQWLGPIYSGVEEAKADVVGLFGLNWLMEMEVVQKEKAQEVYASYVAGIFRSVRFGGAEAHGRAEMMEFNYLAEQNAVALDRKTGRYAIDYAKMTPAIAALAKELLEIEATGDRNRAEQWFQKYGTMPAALKSSLANVKDVPVDVDPWIAFGQKCK